MVLCFFVYSVSLSGIAFITFLSTDLIINRAMIKASSSANGNAAQI